MRRGFHTVSKKGLQRLGRAVLLQLGKSSKRGRVSLVVLNGNLGSGKTTFVQTAAKLLGIRERVLSPTFVFIHEHQIQESRIENQELRRVQFKKLIHVDAYRIETKRDFEAIGLRQYLKDPMNLVLIEWGERITQWLPKPDLTIEFKHHRPQLRKIKIVSGIGE